VPRLRSKVPTHGVDLLSTMPFMTLSIVSSMEIPRPKDAVARPNVVSRVLNSDELGCLVFRLRLQLSYLHVAEPHAIAMILKCDMAGACSSVLGQRSELACLDERLP
jgi:hypothetical protein